MPPEFVYARFAVSRSPLMIIFLVVFIDLLGFGIVLPLLPRYARDFEASWWMIAVLMSSFSAMQFLFAPLWGRLSDRIGRRPVLLIGLAGSAVFYFLFGRITHIGNSGPIYGLSPLFWLLMTRIGAGIAGATISTAQAYIADSTEKAGRGKGMAIIGAAFGIGFTFGPLLGAVSLIGQTEGSGPSAWPGYLAGGLSAVAFGLALFVLPESLKGGATPERRGALFDSNLFRKALARPHIGIILVAIFLTTFAFAQFETTLSLLTKNLGQSDSVNFLTFAYIGFILTVAQGGLVRRLIPKWGEFWMALTGVALMSVGLLLIGWTSSQKSMLLVYCALPVAVIGFSATTPSLHSLLSLCASDDEQGGILGVGQSMSALARILGPLLAIPVQGINLALPYWIGAGLMAVSLGLVITLRDASYLARREGIAAPVGH